MYALTISFGPVGTIWTLLYKEEESAAAAKAQLYSTFDDVTDDFGQRITINRETVHGVMVEDMAQSSLAHIERALHQARTQAKGQEMAETDVMLKSARLRQGGPGIINPMGMQPNGRGF